MDVRPLEGLRVLELGQLVAGPWACTWLATFGADVIKVEPPEGDPLRQWRGLDADGTSLWWRSLARDRRCVQVDLRRPEGQDLVRRLAQRCDVVVENFRPGTLEAWGLSPDVLRQANPGLILCRVSGFGQTGPGRERPGYASVCEAAGGLRYVTGHPGQPSVRPDLSLGDSVAGMQAALGILLALQARARTGLGQDIDVSIAETVLQLTESMIPEADRLGVVRQPSGTALSGVVPSGAWVTSDGRQVVLGANGESVFRRLLGAMGRPELADDARLRGNAARVAHRAEVEGLVAAWVGAHTEAEVLGALRAAGVPSSAVPDARELLVDPHFQAREAFVTLEVGGRALRVPAVGPRLSATPGKSEHAGPDLGAHTGEVLREVLNLADSELEALALAGVIGR